MEIVEPQIGFQQNFLASEADIVIGGSAAGVGKTFALLLEVLRHITTVKGFGGIIFRRTTPQIRNEGGLWDTSMSLYPYLGGVPKESRLEWVFNHKNKLSFSHLEYEKDKLNHQGTQSPFIGFDELTHFTESQFFYMLSRNRSTCGVKPYIRATCNPDPDSWVAGFISWFIDQETGYPILERVGKIRYFIKNGSEYIWGNTKQEVIEKAKFILEKESGELERFIKSMTFITGKLSDNKKLLDIDPTYEANLLSQDEATQSSLLHGNWKHVVNDRDIFKANDFESMFHSTDVGKTGVKAITADIALEGSDKFVIFVWDGLCIIDAVILDKSSGKQVLDSIKEMQIKHQVSNAKIVYDNDGVGGFLGGFIPTGQAFRNGSKALMRENYSNLKTQCVYHMGRLVAEGKVSISEHVQKITYEKYTSVRQRFIHERRSIKKASKTDDGKLKIISKDEMKSTLQGESPDLMDAFIMRYYLELGSSF